MYSESKLLGEFELIERFFKAGSVSTNPSLSLGIGDDCALIKPLSGEEIAITSDMLVKNRHFFAGADSEQLGRKALAVNLSDLAAMGAKPLGFTLALALPAVNTQWLEGFSKGLLMMANEYSCPLVGGDTTAGPLTISITAIGSIPPKSALFRSGAKNGDDIWVSGTIGDARLALAALRHEINLPSQDFAFISQRMHQPTPRVQLGMALRGVASAAIDISDGLLGDLNHILKQSKVDAQILLNKLPKSNTLQMQSLEIQHQFAASGGDDYELCFTAPCNQRETIQKISKTLGLQITCIGHIESMKNAFPQIHLIASDGKTLGDKETATLLKSFDHFSK